MSKQGKLIRARAQFRDVQGEQERRPNRFYAKMGDGDDNVEVAGEGQMAYVRIPGRGVIKCLNTRVPMRNDLPVMVGYSHELPDTLQVLDTYGSMMTGYGSYAYIPAHHQSHEFENADGGDDVVWAQKPQFVEWLCYPTSPASMCVNVNSGFYLHDANWQFFTGAVSEDLTARVPGAGLARFVLVYVDGAANALAYENGASFLVVLPPGTAFDLIPVPPSGSVPVAAIYLPNGTTAIDWAEIYDIRIMVQPMAGTVAPAPHPLLATLTHTDTKDATPPAQGSVMIADGDNDWDELPVGAANEVLTNDGTDTLWSAGAIDLTAGKTLTVSADLTLTGTDGKTLTLTDGLTVEGGNDGTLHFDAAATLTIEANSAIDQDVTTDASPTFANVYVPDGGSFGIAGNELLTVNAGGTFAFSGILGITVEDDDWIGIAADDIRIEFNSSDGAIMAILGDDAGADEFQVVDSGGGVVAYIDSDGNSSFAGTMTIGSGSDIEPADASGQDLGSATNRWDLYASTIIFGSPSGANEIAVPDNLADALGLLDAGGLEYLRIVSTDADPLLLIDPAGTGIKFGIGTAAPAGHVSIEETITTTAPYYGLRMLHTKTAGVTDEDDPLYGIYSYLNMSQAGGVIGSQYGAWLKTELTAGDLGTALAPKSLYTLFGETELEAGGHVFGDVYGNVNRVDLNGGDVDGNVYINQIQGDIEAAMGSIGGSVFGLHVWIDTDEDPAGLAYLAYLDGGSNIDYGFYQNSAEPNHLGGSLNIVGGLTVHGGGDPPYELYWGGENRDTMLERMKRWVPPSRLSGMIIFFNTDTKQMELFRPSTGQFFAIETRLLDQIEPVTETFEPIVSYIFNEVTGEVEECEHPRRPGAFRVRKHHEMDAATGKFYYVVRNEKGEVIERHEKTKGDAVEKRRK